MYSDRQARANTVDPDAGSSGSSLFATHTAIYRHNILYVFKFKNKYGDELRCPNT